MPKEYHRELYKKDMEVTHYIEKHNINVDSSNDLQRKRTFLKDVLKYKGLRIASSNLPNAFCPIDQCKNERIVMTVRETYERAKGRLERLKKGELTLNHLKLEDKIETDENPQLSLF